MKHHLLIALLLASNAPALAMPDFVPEPADVYDDYVALEMPRTEVPVGALWVQDYGPSGEGAAADNLATERSLSQVTISRELQLGLTAGILNLFGIDPSYRNRLSARFGDLSIVRVKDLAKVSGPMSEPRIYEAVRAGTITISTDNDFGLRLETRAAGQNLPVVGRSDNGSRRNFSIDGKDMFIAFRVASQEEVRGSREEVRLTKVDGGWAAALNGRDFVIRTDAACPGTPQPTLPSLPVPVQASTPLGIDLRISPDEGAPVKTIKPALVRPQQTGADQSLALPLHVPIADGKGGLFERAQVEVAGKERKESGNASLCTDRATTVRASVQLLGKRLQAFRKPKAPRW